MTDKSAFKRKPPETSIGEGTQPKGHSRSCTARAKGWKTGAKRNIQTNQTCSSPSSHSTLGRQKKASLPQMSPLCPAPAQPSPSRIELLPLNSSISLPFPQFLQDLIQEEAGRCRTGATGFVCSSFQTLQGACPSPTGPASQRAPYAFKLHYISSAFLPANGPCSGLGASGRAAPLLSFLHAEENCRRSAAPHRLLFL